MTVSITRCWKNPLRIFIAALWLAATFGVWDAWAASIEPLRAQLLQTDEGQALSADFAIDLGPRVEEAVSHGVALYFNLELEVKRPRKYWIDEHIANYNLTYRLSYNPLTRRYRLSTGPLQHLSFDALDQALHALGRIAALPVVDRGVLKPGETYLVAVRLALDRSQLPKPFQLDALANPDWQVSAGVLRWQYQAPEGAK
ncbi:MAG: DUF4390 domain-containing protein [Proteobacteria bacterium]|nr:DUF4390 domain-containing protein [Pseudomonadota bacterium]HQR04070.1 DUF4390 domain-containing protein [Rhodocyclaceae bacterium]